MFGIITALSGALASGDTSTVVAAIAAYAALVVVLIAVFCYAFGWAERRMLAKMQARTGPSRVGGYGLLQNLADLTKLLSKEHAAPDRARKVLFLVALPLALSVTIFLVMLIPLSPAPAALDLGFGALALFVVLSFVPLVAFVGGAASGNKFAETGAQRSVVALLGYEIPLMLVVASVAMMAGSYDFAAIIAAQATGIWYVFLMPIGFIVFFVAMMAAAGRPPFDVRDAGSELAGGLLADASAPYSSLAALADYATVFLGSLVMAIFFFGGWSGPASLPLPPEVWLLAKGFVIALSFVIVRAAMPRMRIDRLLRLGWTILLPLAMLNLIITAVIIIG